MNPELKKLLSQLKIAQFEGDDIQPRDRTIIQLYKALGLRGNTQTTDPNYQGPMGGSPGTADRMPGADTSIYPDPNLVDKLLHLLKIKTWNPKRTGTQQNPSPAERYIDPRFRGFI